MDQWYYQIADQEFGPLRPAQLRVLAAHGRLVPTDLVRRGESGPWVPASRVKGLFGGSAVLSHGGEHPLPDHAHAGPPPLDHVASPTDHADATGSAEAFVPTVPAAAETAYGFLADDLKQVPSRPKSPPAAVVKAAAADRQKRLMLGALIGLSVLFVVLLGVWAFVIFGPQSETPAEATAASTEEKPGGAGPAGAEPPAVVYLEVPKDSWKAGDVAVQVLTGEIGRVRLARDRKVLKQTEDDFLIVRIRLKNLSDTRKLEYTSWSTLTTRPKLVDNFGNEYFMQGFGGTGLTVEGQQRKASIYPEQSVDDVLVFQKPADRAKLLKLHLDGAAVGSEKPGDFAIPTSILIRRPWTGDGAAKEAPKDVPPKPADASTKPNGATANPLPGDAPKSDAANTETGRPKDAASKDAASKGETPAPRAYAKPGHEASKGDGVSKGGGISKGGKDDPFRELPPPDVGTSRSGKAGEAEKKTGSKERSPAKDFGIETVPDDQPTMSDASDDKTPAADKPSTAADKKRPSPRSKDKR